MANLAVKAVQGSAAMPSGDDPCLRSDTPPWMPNKLALIRRLKKSKLLTVSKVIISPIIRGMNLLAKRWRRFTFSGLAKPSLFHKLSRFYGFRQDIISIEYNSNIFKRVNIVIQSLHCPTVGQRPVYLTSSNRGLEFCNIGVKIVPPSSTWSLIKV